MGCFSGRLLALNLNRSEQKKTDCKAHFIPKGSKWGIWICTQEVGRLLPLPGMWSVFRLYLNPMYEQLLQKLIWECLKTHINLSTVLEAEHLEWSLCCRHHTVPCHFCLGLLSQHKEALHNLAPIKAGLTVSCCSQPGGQKDLGPLL